MIKLINYSNLILKLSHLKAGISMHLVMLYLGKSILSDSEVDTFLICTITEYGR